MKSHLILIFSVVLIAMQVFAAENPPLATQKDKLSYSIGLDIGSSLKKKGIEVDADMLLRGLKDGLAGTEPQLTQQQIDETVKTLEKEVGAKRAAVAEKNKADGEAFLAANKSKEGVKTTASGLQYKVLKAGSGQKPKASDTITAHYRGTFIDGTEFDSSYKRGEPATFELSRVIPGWTEGLQLMDVGSKFQFFVPASLGYGENGAADVIGPNSTLIFEVELVSIGQPAAKQEPEKLQPQTQSQPQEH